jgi:hypothetical protein
MPRSASADAFVSTSQHEGFGLVFLEAMACGLPIVCYDRGGQTDFLASGETGFVVKLNDTLVSAMQSVQSMPTFICGGARPAGTGTGRNYFIDSCAARYEKVFEAAIDRRLAQERGVAPTQSLIHSPITFMCGIAGIVSTDRARDIAMRRMLEALAHRGPGRRRHVSRRARDARASPPVDHRSGRRPAAAAERRSLDRAGLQWRDLQLPRTAAVSWKTTAMHF